MFAHKKITGARGTLTTLTEHTLCIWLLGCLLALCGVFQTIFFLLSVWSPCYTLSRGKPLLGLWGVAVTVTLYGHAKWLKSRTLIERLF